LLTEKQAVLYSGFTIKGRFDTMGFNSERIKNLSLKYVEHYDEAITKHGFREEKAKLYAKAIVVKKYGKEKAKAFAEASLRSNEYNMIEGFIYASCKLKLDDEKSYEFAGKYSSKMNSYNTDEFEAKEYAYSIVVLGKREAFSEGFVYGRKDFEMDEKKASVYAQYYSDAVLLSNMRGREVREEALKKYKEFLAKTS
jgi:hypothetical protein